MISSSSSATLQGEQIGHLECEMTPEPKKTRATSSYRDLKAWGLVDGDDGEYGTLRDPADKTLMPVQYK